LSSEFTWGVTVSCVFTSVNATPVVARPPPPSVEVGYGIWLSMSNSASVLSFVSVKGVVTRREFSRLATASMMIGILSAAPAVRRPTNPFWMFGVRVICCVVGSMLMFVRL